MTRNEEDKVTHKDMKKKKHEGRRRFAWKEERTDWNMIGRRSKLSDFSLMHYGAFAVIVAVAVVFVTIAEGKQPYLTITAIIFFILAFILWQQLPKK